MQNERHLFVNKPNLNKQRQIINESERKREGERGKVNSHVVVVVVVGELDTNR